MKIIYISKDGVIVEDSYNVDRERESTCDYILKYDERQSGLYVSHNTQQIEGCEMECKFVSKELSKAYKLKEILDTALDQIVE